VEKNNYQLLQEYVSLLLESGRREPMDLHIPQDVQDIHDRMRRAGKELYVVGGAVRDTLLNKKPKDYDLATNATPDQTLRILERDGKLKTDLQGKAFGVIRVFTPEGNEYEIATFRKDIGKGKETEVEFTTIENDVNRRDLTMNALFYDLNSGEVVDYVGGIDDIRSGVTKAVGDPALRFAEDKLRMLRAARFAARTGFDIDPETADAIKSDPGLRFGEGKVGGEDRIAEEFKKGVTSATSPSQYIELLHELGLLSQIFPGLATVPNTGSESDSPLIQVAALLRNNHPDDVSSTLHSLRYSNDEKNIVNFLLRFADISPDTAPALKSLFKRHSISDVYLYDFADAVGIPSRKNTKAFIEFALSPPAVSAGELMAQGLKPGPDIGKAMAAAEIEAYAEMVGEAILGKIYGSLLNEKF